MSQPNRRIIFLTMYAMDRVDQGPAVRAHNIRRALAQFAEVDFICGERRERRQSIRRYLESNKVEGTDGLYVETSTSWCTVEDLQLMAACRRAGVPVITWIMDAYPLYPETMAGIPLHKRLISSLLWQLSMWRYFQASDAIAVQTESFGKLFERPDHLSQIILNPAANFFQVPPISAQANVLLYTGNASQSRFGVDLLAEAAEIAHSDLPNLRLVLVCPPSGVPPKALYAHRPWIELMSLSTDEIVGLLSQVRALANPLRDVPYHRLQIPTKVMDYLGYGRPILATDLPEITRIIQGTGAGLVVPATAQGLADGIRRLFTADLDELNRMGQNALRAVREKHSWHHRAQILGTFEEIRQRDSLRK
jgi:glycosyltransferase involved in cell wall biosynthesis